MSFYFYSSPDHQHLPSFPTRRSSDLRRSSNTTITSPGCRRHAGSRSSSRPASACTTSPKAWRSDSRPPEKLRSEEHTSELQSRFDLVCRLLLEKKNISSYYSLLLFCY